MKKIFGALLSLLATSAAFVSSARANSSVTIRPMGNMRGYSVAACSASGECGEPVRMRTGTSEILELPEEMMVDGAIPMVQILHNGKQVAVLESVKPGSTVTLNVNLKNKQADYVSERTVVKVIRENKQATWQTSVR